MDKTSIFAFTAVCPFILFYRKCSFLKDEECSVRHKVPEQNGGQANKLLAQDVN